MRKKSPIVINVPHASLLIPEEEMQFFERPKLIRELVAMTDHCCDDLFDTGHEMLVFPVSRLVCDFERFRDDAALKPEYQRIKEDISEEVQILEESVMR